MKESQSLHCNVLTILGQSTAKSHNKIKKPVQGLSEHIQYFVNIQTEDNSKAQMSYNQ